MKQLKNRKTLTLVLCLVLVSVFTLTIAYSALNAVLTINGNARVSAADWDIYLNNPRVTSGSATTNLPVIKTSSTLEFETTLNMPGDFYEFVVDVVNAGDIDAMIENVVKTPDLTAEQAKFLKYEVSYQNGESITTKQLLAKDTTMPIKVRIEYRKDLSNTDLPTGQVVLDLSLTLEYSQSDGTGSTVPNNGEDVNITASGNVNELGTIVTIGSEQFYTFGTDGNNVKLLAMYNLYVGGKYDSTTGKWEPYGTEATGRQNSEMRGTVMNESIANGVTGFYTEEQINSNDFSYENSLVNQYLKNYNDYLVSLGINIEETRLIKGNELSILGCSFGNCDCISAPNYIKSQSYWAVDSNSNDCLWSVYQSGFFDYDIYYDDYKYDLGVRPVIVISKDYFN